MEKKKQKIIVINSLSKMEWILIDDIFFLENDRNYTEIHLANGKIITVCHSLTHCCDQLDKSIIYHVCAHYAVNIFQIKEYIRGSRIVKFSDEISITIPEDKVKAFYQFLEDNFIQM